MRLSGERGLGIWESSPNLCDLGLMIVPLGPLSQQTFGERVCTVCYTPCQLWGISK